MSNPNFSQIETVLLDDADSAIVILDQTKLPGTCEIKHLHTQPEIHDAIYRLCVRGAPAIGITAGMAYYLAAKEHIKENPAITPDDLTALLKKDKAYMASSRPTAVNLFWALDRMEGVYLANREKDNTEILSLLRVECEEIKAEDIRVCRAIGEYGLTLVKPGDGILTTATPVVLPPQSTVPQPHRFISVMSAATISVSLPMKQDRFCRAHV